MPPALLIDNGTVCTAGAKPEVLIGHSVLIEDGRIARVAPRNRFRLFDGKRIDAASKLVMPGLINAHTHFYSTFARGLTGTRPAADFQGVLKQLWWRLDSALSLEDCYFSALIPLMDSIRHGTTTLIDHHASPRAVRGSLAAIARAVRQTGLRACLAYEVSDRDGARVAREGLEENAAFIRQCQASGPGEPASPSTSRSAGSRGRADGEDNRLCALFGLHASFTLSDRTLEAAAGMARELGAGFHIHVAEAASDQQHCLARFGCRVVDRLHRHGILGPGTIAAHAVHVDRKEIELLAKTHTAVVHNPQSNLNNAVGIADVVTLAGHGVRLGLGTDAMTTNLLEELRVALWAQHWRAHHPSVGFSEVVQALVSGNPTIASGLFGVPLGELREGAAADVIVVDYDPPTPLDRSNLFGHLVFGVPEAAVATTIVGGRVLMQDRRLTLDLDEARIRARARESARKLWKRL